MKSPFKFLDSYTKDDREIFFGRDREIEELYQRVFDSKLLLVYGVSGTGKSSLIHCGLANKFRETDWLPLIVRRGGNIIESTASAIKAASLTPQVGQFVTPVNFKKGVRSLYLDHYKPVFFIFDQFEELFIFGDKEERKSFVQIIKSLIESDLQCRLIFVMREEYMAGVTEFERYIPTFFSNRVRIEKMSHTNALEAIKEPCKVFNISLEEGFAESLLEKLSPESADVELTYLQVFLDKIFHLAQGEKDQKSLSFTLPLLEKAGNVSDLLGSFLEEQIKELDEPDTGLTILKSFVSVKGTKKQLTQEEIIESSRSLGKDIPVTVVSELLQKFVNLRILRDKDENGKYELRHDSLATKIYEKITIVEKELMEIYQFLENAYSAFEKRKVLLNANDLRYIAPYEDRLFVKRETGNLIELSKNELNKIKKRIKRIAVSGLVAILIFSIGVIFSVYRFPLSSQLRSLGLIVYVVWFLPVFAYYIFRTKDNRTMNLLFLIFTLLFVGTTFIYIRSTSARLWRLYSNPLIQNDKEISEVTKRYTIKTDSIYNNMIKNSEGHADKSGEYILTVTGVKEKTLELVNYIQDLKISILTMSEGEDTPSKEGREINFAKINHMDEANVPSQVMVGANYNGKAFALNELVQRYKVYINNTVKNEPALAEGIDITLDLNDKIIKDSDKDSSYLQPWEQYYFQGKGMGIVLNTLSQLQSDIKYCESEVITYLYTKMSTEIYLDSSKKH